MNLINWNECNVELLHARDKIFVPLNFICSNLEKDIESSEYAACSFLLNGAMVKFRVSKITPTKTGSFVTLWKRISNGPIRPYDASDNIELFIIATCNKNRRGLFVFSKSVLMEQGIISSSKKEGKRAIRVYSPWDKANSTQALKTQNWQLKYFLDLSSDLMLDYSKAKNLFFQK